MTRYLAERGHPCADDDCYHAACLVMRGAGAVRERTPSTGTRAGGLHHVRETVKRARFEPDGEIVTEDTMPTRIAVIVEGGIVQNVIADSADVRVVVVDHDKERTQ